MSESSGRALALAVCILMVITGSLNTIFAKWADMLKYEGVTFNHPILQAICMFFGEFLCLVVFFVIHVYRKYRWNKANISGELGSIVDITSDSEPTLPQFNPFVFLLPACCDILATSIMYVGLNLTTASSFQMLRGAVIVFTGLLSVGLLGARIQGYKWVGMLFVILGLVVVGVTDMFYHNNPVDDKNAIMTGNLLIIMAQIIVAIQMVYEQKYLIQYDVPALFAVGLEGLFGMTILCILLAPMYYIHVPRTFSTNPEGRLDISFFNFAGVSVTKELSATTRMVLDSVRTLVVWIVSIPVFGETFIFAQLIGFGFLIFGMFVYNDTIIGPWFRRHVLPRMGESHVFTRCCFSICGAELLETEADNLINDDE